MDITGFISRARKLFSYSRKPDGKELKLTTKITLIGLLFVGLIAYLIQLLFSLFGGIWPG
ncbi:MAG: protein translocase SEC61 complex subunit gamma [Candidatus Hodarchaeota archaeon]